jgi:uncharacterized RDD family membrane protein YckC
MSAREITFTPPEGVPIRFQIASGGARVGAQLLDLVFTWGGGLAFVLLVAWSGLIGWEAWLTLLSLLVFLLRVPYYILSELVWNGRTPGKRVVGIRVIAANGRRLTPSQIAARNLLKEVEFFTPFTLILAASSDSLGSWGIGILLVWVTVVSIVPLANRRRQRLGDMIAGTLVVETPKPVLLPDLVRTARPVIGARFTFLPHQLDHYGRHELQVLEDILRGPEGAAGRSTELVKVTGAIAAKIAYTDPIPPYLRQEFLLAFYTAQRDHLEKRRLFGDRRENKHHGQGG